MRVRALLIGLVLTAVVSQGPLPGHAADNALRLYLVGGERVPETKEIEAFFTASKMSTVPRRGALLQFESLPTDAQRETLNRLGVSLYTYIPDRAFLAAIPTTASWSDLRATGARWVGLLRPEDKTAEVLVGMTGAPNWSRDSSGLARFTVLVFPHIDLDDASGWLTDEYGARVLAASSLAHSVEVGLPAENWLDVVRDERVLWVEPFLPRREDNNSNRTNVRADVAQAPPYSLTGAGVMIGEWDGGRADPSHPDFGGRVLAGDGAAIATHATHVAGTVLGSGVGSGGTYRGMAPSAVIVSQLWWTSSAELQSEYQNAINDYEMDITTNSWSVGITPPSQSNCQAFLGNYYSECGTLDNLIRGGAGKTVVVSWSAGNQRSTQSDYCGSVGFTWGTVTPYGTSKNVITVGAINSDNSTMTSFSSWGPTDDGRLKPEVVAPGCQAGGPDFGVTSTKLTSGYTVMCGTSMSAPTVTGCVSLWLERYHTLHGGQTPLASTVKAAFVESADDLGDAGPEYDWGYGRVDVTSAVDLLNAGTLLEDQVSNGGTRSWQFINDGSLSQISFTLAWDDPGAAGGASVTLINNLDIVLRPPSGTPVQYPWVLNPASPGANATHGVNNRDNLEQVRINAPLEAGTWTVEVNGTSVPQGPQPFSLAYSPNIVLLGGSPYAVMLTAAVDTSVVPGAMPARFHLRNVGSQSDAYDLTLTSKRGWSITPNPVIVALPSLADSNLTFTLTIPPSAPLGTLDTIIGVAVSQGNGSVSDRDTMRVMVLSGRAVSVDAGRDTMGVPGHQIAQPVHLSNTGVVDDSIDWSVTNQAGWAVVPATGTVWVAAGRDTALLVSATISGGAVPGTSNRLIVNGVTLGDIEATDADTALISVINFPPLSVLVSPADGALTNNPRPALLWSHVPYSPPPPGFDVFSHVVETADDSAFALGRYRYGPVAETTLTVTDSLTDGVHYWRVLTLNAVGDSSGFTAPRSLEIDTKAPDAPVLLSPADDTADADSTPLFTWAPVTDTKSGQTAIAYRWQGSTDAGFGGAVDSIWTDATSYQVPPEAALPTCSTTVYWRVLARDAAGNTSPSSPVFHYELYRPGDVHFDCIYDILDVVALVEFVFRGGSTPVPPGRAETNCQPPSDIQDLVRLVDHVFRGGARPCGPS
ncbi:MAG: S8 family serine peptidase [Candidatus Zixiibacteriota bacterium]